MNKSVTKHSLATTTVLDVVPFGQGDASIFALRLTPPDWASWKPGQFVMVRQPDTQETVWGRPLSICRVSPNNLVLLFQAVGRATRELTKLVSGDKLDVWGPLGNSFHVDKDGATLLLAGGIGIAPFMGYVEEHPAPWNISIEFGHRLPLECYPVHSLQEKVSLNSFCERTPEDLAIFITRMEESVAQHIINIKESKSGTGVILACGPTPFLRTVQSLALKNNLKAQLSLGNRMACGIGACLGCVTKVRPNKDGKIIGPAQVQTCTRGPIFWAEEITL